MRVLKKKKEKEGTCSGANMVGCVTWILCEVMYPFTSSCMPGGARQCFQRESHLLITYWSEYTKIPTDFLDISVMYPFTSSCMPGVRFSLWTRRTLEPLAWHWSHWPGRLVNRGGVALQQRKQPSFSVSTQWAPTVNLTRHLVVT